MKISKSNKVFLKDNDGSIQITVSPYDEGEVIEVNNDGTVCVEFVDKEEGINLKLVIPAIDLTTNNPNK